MPKVRIAALTVLVVVLVGLGHSVAKSRAAAPRAPAPTAFSSPSTCRALVESGQRFHRPSGMARFASWNLRWFPDGQPGEGAAEADLGWLSCALAWLDVDVLAVQEVKQTPSATRALARLLSEVNRLTGGRYVARLDDCGHRVTQHVGLIWNEARVTAGSIETVAALNPAGRACAEQLRPGLAAQLKLSGGLDLTVLSAHFKSKADPRAFALRSRSFASVPGVFADWAARTRDTDVLLLGDLNTMGCRTCQPRISARDEQAKVRQGLEDAGLSLVPADASGSHVSGGRATLLDHAVVRAAMRELPKTSRVHVAGWCGDRAGKDDEPAHPRRALSDHCPIVLDLIDRDLD